MSPHQPKEYNILDTAAIMLYQYYACIGKNGLSLYMYTSPRAYGPDITHYYYQIIQVTNILPGLALQCTCKIFIADHEVSQILFDQGVDDISISSDVFIAGLALGLTILHNT